MFNVPALLLEDALHVKPATPLTNKMLRQFAQLSDILQGSNTLELVWSLVMILLQILFWFWQ